MPLDVDWSIVSSELGIAVSNEPAPSVKDVEAKEPEETVEEPAAEETENVSEDVQEPKPEEEPEAEKPDDKPKVDEEDEEEDAPDDTPKWALRRIGKLTARNTEAKKLAEEAKAQVEEYKAKYEALVAVKPETSIDDDLAQVDNIRAWALDNLDGGTITKPDGTEEFIDGPKVREYLKKADDRVLELKLKAREVEQASKSFEAEARKAYPEIFDPALPASKAVDTFIAEHPHVKRIPNIKLVLGDALLGQAVRTGTLKLAEEHSRTESAKAKVAPKVPSPEKPVKVPASKAPPRKLSADFANSKEGMEEYILQNILK